VGFGTNSQNFTNTTFDDGALRSITSRQSQAPFSSPPSYRPQQPLSKLQKQSINGIWTLEIQNSGRGSVTTFNNWSLRITPGTPTTSTSDGNTMDQNADGSAGDTGADVYSIPTPVGGTPFVAPFSQTTLPLIVPGPHVVDSHIPGAPV